MTQNNVLQRIDRERPPWVGAATGDAIRHFAWGIGDNNPLWIDRDHAAASPWGSLIAPPSFLYAVDETTVAPGHNNLRRVYQSVDWTFYDIVREGTDMKSEATLTEEDDSSGSLLQTGRVDFLDGNSRLVATAMATTMRTDAPGTTIEARPEIRYSGEELEAIERTILSERRQGAEPLYVEDVQAGASPGPLIKGPLSIMDIVAWSAGAGGAVEPDAELSEGGLPHQCATGPQQVSWIAQAITDWMGDGGFLHKLSVNLVSNPVLGSTTTIAGAVEEVRPESRPHVLLSLNAAGGLGHSMSKMSSQAHHWAR